MSLLDKKEAEPVIRTADSRTSFLAVSQRFTSEIRIWRAKNQAAGAVSALSQKVVFRAAKATFAETFAEPKVSMKPGDTELRDAPFRA